MSSKPGAREIELDEPLLGVASSYPAPAARQDQPGAEDFHIAPSRYDPSRRRPNEMAGYGKDPNLVTPAARWPRMLTHYEREIIDVLSDLLLPATPKDPAPSHVGIAEFFDDWLSAPYDTQVDDRALVLPGLYNLDALAQEKFRKGFAKLRATERKTVLDELILASDNGRTFFLRFRYLAIGGYFTCDRGMRALGYRGNVPLEKPKQVPPDILSTIDAELKKLGL